MRRFIGLAGWLALLPGLCSAWGPQGHEAIGWVAESYLTPKARAEVSRLLQGRSLGDNNVANWPDFIRGDKRYDTVYPENGKWHYLDIDVAWTNTNYAVPEDGNDVVDQIIRWQKALGVTNATPQAREDALKFLVHFVGDIHQPLHCACRDNDRGGNEVPVHSFTGEAFAITRDTPEGKRSRPNLHKVWDEYLINEILHGRTSRELADDLLKTMPVDAASRWEKDGPSQWAWDGHLLASSQVYHFIDGTPLPRAATQRPLDLKTANYIAGNLPVVREQLQKAGLRLAWLVNQALDPP